MRFRFRRPAVLLVPLSLVTGALGGTGCFDPTLVGDAGGDGAPNAVLTLSATAGQAPLAVVLDASASTAFNDGGALTFDFDFDGDGTFEIERADDATVEHSYDTGGSFKAVVRVRGDDGRFDLDEAELEVSPENAPRTADVDVDSDNDGRVTGADEAVEDDSAAGFMGNVDDDNGDGVRDRDDQNLDDEDDDTTAVIVRHARGLSGEKVFVQVSPTLAAQRIRLWSGKSILIDGATPRAEVPGAASGDVELRLEAITGRTIDWDGRLTITVTVEAPSGSDGVLSTDEVLLRAAPVLFPDNLQAPKRLFVMDLQNGDDNNVAMMSAIREALPSTAGGNVELYTLNPDNYFYDRWVQDSWEVGSQTLPAPPGEGGYGGQREMITAMQTERFYGGEGLDAFVPGEWVSAGRGFYYPSGDESSHNYGGNLETSPPTAQDPFGRMLFGGGNQTLNGAFNPDTMNSAQVGFLDAQEAQGPAVELSSEWLAVGHIDEIFQFVPVLNADAGAHPFKVVIASPRLARDVLVALQNDGNGSARVFSNRRASYSVDEILGAEEFNALNELAQARIDAVQNVMKSALGLTDEDFRPVPVLFDDVDGSGLVAAFNPGIQNLVTVGDRVFAPDPEGPVIDGVDAWQQATVASLADTDLDVVFVDVFESYHELLGEAHCGTNLERAPYSTPWWTVKE